MSKTLVESNDGSHNTQSVCNHTIEPQNLLDFVFCDPIDGNVNSDWRLPSWGENNKTLTEITVYVSVAAHNIAWKSQIRRTFAVVTHFFFFFAFGATKFRGRIMFEDWKGVQPRTRWNREKFDLRLVQFEWHTQLYRMVFISNGFCLVAAADVTTFFFCTQFLAMAKQ